MDIRELEPAREFVCRLENGRDWRRQIEATAAERDVEAAWFLGIGAVEDAEIYFYDQDDHRYESVTFPEPLEVATCVGNVSLLDGDYFAHTHAVCSRADGTAVAGHLHSATVFAGELWLRTFSDVLEREPDAETGLDLWGL